jgi:hypothetical protein
MENSKRDDNYITTLLGVDMTTGLLPTKVYVDETTHRLLVSAVITSMPDVVVTGVATEATLAKVNTNLEEYGINNIDPVSAVLTYTGKEDKDGNWLIVSIDTTTGTVITYATVANNPATTTYASAWSGRAGLTYNVFSGAF